MAGSSATLLSRAVTWKLTRVARSPRARSSSRAATSVRTPSTASSKRSPSMSACAVSAVAPFHEIFTSDAERARSLAHPALPRRGNVPFVVTFTRTPRSSQSATSAGSAGHSSGSPRVEGMTSSRPRSTC